MKKTLICVCLAAFLSGMAQETSTIYDLDEAIEYGLSNNPNIQNANIEIQKAYKERWATIAIGLPQINVTGNYQNF